MTFANHPKKSKNKLTKNTTTTSTSIRFITVNKQTNKKLIRKPTKNY